MLIGRSYIGTIAHMSGGLEVPSPFVRSWSDMIQYNYEYLLKPTERIFYDEATVSYHSFARDGLVDQMRGDWLLMLDTDIAFEPDLATRMLHKMNSYSIDVLVGLYPYKGETPAPVAYGFDPKKKRRFILGDWDRTIDIQEIHAAGAGCLMVRKEVFKRIKKELKQSAFSIIEPYSEDNSFFERLHKLGIKAYFSQSIKIEHLIYKRLSIEKDYDVSKYKIGRRIEVEGLKL